MDLETTLELESNNPAETEIIAEYIGKHVKGGEVFELKSDLGGGKTTFVRGLARGIGSKDVVSSPSFTITNVYQAEHQVDHKSKTLFIHHFDFYRLNEKPELVAHELSDALHDKANIVVLEWAASVVNLLPPNRMRITLEKIDENSRQLTIHCPIELYYLVDGIESKVR